ncbi:hypothetical protein J4229_02495 [Candidatus Pacearchaeota archaeon]|nr:hypothetical protein [Candidatus Pacearchaeota archaeon]
MIKIKPIVWGILATMGIILFYISVLSIFSGFSFALSQFKSLWIWLLPLALGFGTQIGLFMSIKNNACVRKDVATSGTISGGSMVVCCSHFLFNFIPILGLPVLGSLLMTYQKVFFGIGIISSIIGIFILINHKNEMLNHKNKVKGGKKLMDKKVLIYGALIAIVLILTLASFGVIKFGSSSTAGASSSTSINGDMPEKCKVGAGYNLQSWKEHLGHHAETRECLQYYS